MRRFGSVILKHIVLMRNKQLTNFIQLANQKLTIPLGGADYQKNQIQVQLVNQTCHFVFNDRQTKKDTYKSLIGEGSIYVFDCGLDGFNYLGDECIVNSDFATMDQLLESLRSILTIGTNEDTKHPLYNRIINTVIIDNLSVYYWDLKLLNGDTKYHDRLGYTLEVPGLEYYIKLISVLQEIQMKYNCNIVTSSWDNSFEKGYNYSGSSICEFTDLDSLTFLPPRYLMEFDYLIHKSSSSDIRSRIYNKLAGQWVGIV